jgi:uncharacterized protein YyaL (SSP411 family)
MPNRLIHATSPYLIQHAHNPVDWYEWGDEALQKALAEDKPILVSIGYSSCHWCHVMERESFEKEHVAEVMNKFFICIKVDREERPDIDQIYMDAVHMLGVHGGWPLNVFLTPEQKPFFGGTYFSPQVWIEVLNNINKAYRANRDQIEETAEELRLHLLTSEVARYKQVPTNSELMTDLESMLTLMESKFDRKWGGMDKEPKFIMPSIWHFLFRHYHLTKNQSALDHTTFTLKKIAMGGIYDQVGGGFSRYSVDRYWFAPHFEKMLYDNAQLLSLYSEAYAITKEDAFKKVVYESFEWLQREMLHENGGFYSALDADSEGVEGKYYIWTKKELVEVLQEEEVLISSYYSAKEEGNWEHGSNILMRIKEDEQFLKDHSISADEWNPILDRARKNLLNARSKRIAPALDDKIIAAWNAMTICGLIDAYRIFTDRIFLDVARGAIQFLENQMMSGTTLYRSFKNKRSTTQAFLDDYAFLIQAYIRIYQATLEEKYIVRASEMMEHVIVGFYDESDGFFFYTSKHSETLIARKKEIFDNVIPSSNAVMAQNLNQLGVMLDRDDWKKMAVAMADSLSHLVKSEPGFMSHWAIAQTEIKKGFEEIVLVGNGIDPLRSRIQSNFLPFSLFQGSEKEGSLPLQKDKLPLDGKPTIYVCHNKTCQLPVHSVNEALAQLEITATTS